MEKETNKSKIIFITAIICIALCIPIGIILGRTLLSKNESNKTNNNTQNNLTNKIDNVIDNTLDIINNTINNVQNESSINFNSFTDLYYEDAIDSLNTFANNFAIANKNLYNGNYNIKNISETDKLYSIIKYMAKDGLIKSSCSNDRKLITYEKLNEYSKKFNTQILKLSSYSNYNESDIKKLTEKYKDSETYHIYNYYNIEFKDNALDISSPCDMLGSITPNRKIIKAVKENNNLIIYAKIYFIVPGHVYKDSESKNVIYEATGNEFNFVESENYDKMDTYKYTFTKDGYNYKFVSLEKIK